MILTATDTLMLPIAWLWVAEALPLIIRETDLRGLRSWRALTPKPLPGRPRLPPGVCI